MMIAKHECRPRVRAPLRSRAWFDNPANPDMTALYLEKYLNFGLSLEELQGDRPIIGIAQTGSDLAPCNRHHLVLAERVKQGIREAGGIPLEFPMHPIQETGKRPTAGLDRNLAYLSLVEVLFGYPLDGVVLTIGCDKTTPACLMAAATVNIPAIALSVGPMLNGWHRRRAHGLRHDRVEGARFARGRRDRLQGLHRAGRLVGAVDRLLQHHGHGDDDELAHRSARACRCRVSAAIPGAVSRPTGMRVAHRPADRRDGACRPQAFRHPDARGVHQRDPRELGDRRLDQRADSSQCHRATHAGVELTLDDWETLRPSTFRCW